MNSSIVRTHTFIETCPLFVGNLGNFRKVLHLDLFAY
ncbi:hypothetical protein PM8797T_27417 [Gimesia maris DSM 8797]|nr:hypothetical protein PM8797T_27417 [Gimesia maris DSM 8797]